MIPIIAGACIALVSVCVGVCIGYRLRGGQSPLDMDGIPLRFIGEDMPAPYVPGDADDYE